MQFGAADGTWWRGGEFRSVSIQRVAKDRVVWGKAYLELEVHGLYGRRSELFMEIMSIVEGMAAAEMYERAMAFLRGDAALVEPDSAVLKQTQGWEREGFIIRRGGGFGMSLG